jgi:hypothetical protein
MKHTAIPMNDIKSSQVEASGYDSLSRTLSVKFRSGATYHYHDVDPLSADKLIKAESFGKHLQTHIVGKHKYTKYEQQ